ncbi:hypothetical protein H5410_062732 [Solanum commersonii]|uniref:Uncharacterized protein n=1 Tax=Solanum commersonii TaxID=4109 RepID=A0A9J5WDK5_SOLCO|nr:hypothetical protein H5410_062732 [Solanum commersonii]
MSIHDQAEAVVLSQIVMAADGTHIGLALASILKFKANSPPFTKSTTHHRSVSPISVHYSPLPTIIYQVCHPSNVSSLLHVSDFI